MKRAFVSFTVVCLLLAAISCGHAALPSWKLWTDWQGNTLPATGIGPEGAWSYGYNSTFDPYNPLNFTYAPFTVWDTDWLGIGTPAYCYALDGVPGIGNSSYNYYRSHSPTAVQWTAPRDMAVDVYSWNELLYISPDRPQHVIIMKKHGSDPYYVYYNQAVNSGSPTANVALYNLELMTGDRIYFYNVPDPTPSGWGWFFDIEYWVLENKPIGKFPVVVLAYDNTGDFGPNTPGTATSGWQEAVNWCVNNHRDLYVKGGANGASYSVSTTINIPATKNFKISGGNYNMNWSGPSGQDMVGINSASDCHYEFGILCYTGAAAALRIRPQTAVDGEASFRNSSVKSATIVQTGGTPQGSGVIFDLTYAPIRYSTFDFMAVGGFTACISPTGENSCTFNSVKASNLHTDAINSCLLCAGSTWTQNTVDVTVGGDGTPAGLVGVYVQGQNNQLTVNTMGGFASGNTLAFGTLAAGNQAKIILVPGGPDMAAVLSDGSTAATNQVCGVGKPAGIQGIWGPVGVWNYTLRLFPAILRVVSGDVYNVRHFRGGNVEEYINTPRVDIAASPGDILQVCTTSSAPHLQIIPMVK